MTTAGDVVSEILASAAVLKDAAPALSKEELEIESLIARYDDHTHTDTTCFSLSLCM